MPSSQFAEIQKKKHRIVRSSSHGADISLVAAYDGFHAGFECATKVAEVLGPAGLKEWSDVQSYVIPLADMPKACEKLSQKYSIALLDQLPNEKGNIAWGLIWKIRRGDGGPIASIEPSRLLEDY